MNTQYIKLFDSNNNLVSNFDDIIEDVLISVHGENYYDTDEALINTKLITPIKAEVLRDYDTLDDEDNTIYKDDELEKTIEIVDAMADKKNSVKINIVDENEEKKKAKFKDFVPALFFFLIFVVIIIAGYYFLNTADLANLLKG